MLAGVANQSRPAGTPPMWIPIVLTQIVVVTYAPRGASVQMCLIGRVAKPAATATAADPTAACALPSPLAAAAAAAGAAPASSSSGGGGGGDGGDCAPAMAEAARSDHVLAALALVGLAQGSSRVQAEAAGTAEGTAEGTPGGKAGGTAGGTAEGMADAPPQVPLPAGATPHYHAASPASALAEPTVALPPPATAPAAVAAHLSADLAVPPLFREPAPWAASLPNRGAWALPLASPRLGLHLDPAASAGMAAGFFHHYPPARHLPGAAPRPPSVFFTCPPARPPACPWGCPGGCAHVAALSMGTLLGQPGSANANGSRFM